MTEALAIAGILARIEKLEASGEPGIPEHVCVHIVDGPQFRASQGYWTHCMVCYNTGVQRLELTA